MSREELVEAYVDGRMGRRVFIRGLVALGVSAAAAVTYAEALSAASVPPAAVAADMYSPTTTTDMYSPTTTAAPSDPGAEGDQAGRGGAAAPATVRPRFTG